jgi:hypothetical protein
MSNISPQKNARTTEQNISLRNLCKNFWLEETAILDMQMSKLPMISGNAIYRTRVSLLYAIMKLLMTYHRFFNKSSTTGATCGAGTVYPSGAQHLRSPPVFSGVRATRSLVFMCNVLLIAVSFCPFRLAIVLSVL